MDCKQSLTAVALVISGLHTGAVCLTDTQGSRIIAESRQAHADAARALRNAFEKDLHP